MKLLKFGGSSVGTPQRIEQVISILKTYVAKKEKFAVVFSAFQGVTDQLIETSELAVRRDDKYLLEYTNIYQRHITAIDDLVKAEKQRKFLLPRIEELFKELKEILHGILLTKELTPRSMDYIMSFGERFSNRIIASAMQSQGLSAEYLDSRLLIKTDDNFGNAKVNFAKTNKNIIEYFKKHKSIQIITGFIGSTAENETTTIGRGGSDYTASIFGAALNVKEIEIWTDVDGILTADPRVVKNAFSVKAVTYEEAMEMSHFGAKVIHPPTMLPALNKNIKLRIRNTFNPQFKGTLILERERDIDFKVKGISSIPNISLLRVTGSSMTGISAVTSRIFSSLSKKDISVLMITQASSGHSICIAVMPDKAKLVKATIDEEFRLEIHDKEIQPTFIEDEMAVIAVVGEDMRNTPGIAGKVFRALGKNGISIRAIAQGSSEQNISLVISNTSLQKAVNVLHDAVFLSQKKNLNVFMIGPGLVGKAFLEVIKDRAEHIAKIQNVKINLVGLANSKKMVFDENGIDLNNWNKILSKSKTPSDVKTFVSNMTLMDLSNSIFVDCTANDLVVPFYNSILGDSISIVTPNKIANSGKYSLYTKLRETAIENNVQFRYATNVGAGMPIINALQDLVNNGDEIIKIEGILSGTLSYLFNEFKYSDNTFSEIVKSAKASGFTEPDPRDDLNGLDMARKLLILIRETGMEMDLRNLVIENLIPKNARGNISVDDFLSKLEKNDKDYDKLKAAAAKKGKVLSYIAKYEKGKAKVGIEMIDSNHPFYALTGVDNIVAFTTKYYNDKPLILKGRGAGAEFTASGVYADVIRISKYLS
ncbi:MAG: bifunctional aspartate kinase/homoserine dehydrogenase I [Bacteroidetes bacterium]|nr:bifunctional aspartate kinase/homoserine dehydrogenase I [Bacteroidota bacterium]